jgi:hypothetical protein
MKAMGLAGWLVGAVLAAGCGNSSSGACPNDLPASCPSVVPSYASTIAPMITNNCIVCHEPGGVSEHYLQTYAEVHELQGPNLDQVYACLMPPVGSPPITSEQRTAFLTWLVCNSPDN